MAQRVAVIGENLVDLFVNSEGVITGVVGGGPLNVARTVARLGGNADFVSGISDDIFGRRIREVATADGVHLARPVASPRPTTMALVELSAGDARYHFHLRDTAAFDVDDVSDLVDVGALYVGTLGLVVAPMADSCLLAVRNADERTLVVLDPNCRPQATPHREEYVTRIIALCARTDVLKVSVDDLDFLFPGLDPQSGGEKLREAGARLVVVTDGGEPIRALVGERWIEVPVAPVAVVDTVGAGDSLVGAFIVWWLGHDLSRSSLVDESFVDPALRAAVDVSRRTCMVHGAEPPHLDEVLSEDTWSWARTDSSTTPSTP